MSNSKWKRAQTCWKDFLTATSLNFLWFCIILYHANCGLSKSQTSWYLPCQWHWTSRHLKPTSHHLKVLPDKVCLSSFLFVRQVWLVFPDFHRFRACRWFHHVLAKMLIKVKTLTGKEIEIDIEPTDKVERIKVYMKRILILWTSLFV